MQAGIIVQVKVCAFTQRAKRETEKKFKGKGKKEKEKFFVREKRTLTLDHVTRSLAASPSSSTTSCAITSSGMSRPLAYSIKAQQGLHPLVSRRSSMYDSRSGIIPSERSPAC